MKTVQSIVIRINKELPEAISSNILTGEKASSKKFSFPEPTEVIINAKNAQKYNVVINFNESIIIYLKVI